MEETRKPEIRELRARIPKEWIRELKERLGEPRICELQAHE